MRVRVGARYVRRQPRDVRETRPTRAPPANVLTPLQEIAALVGRPRRIFIFYLKKIQNKHLNSEHIIIRFVPKCFYFFFLKTLKRVQIYYLWR